MTVTVEEVGITSAVASTSSSISFTTTFVTSDLMILVFSRNASAVPSALSIDGITPTQYGSTMRPGLDNTRVSIYTATGMTGSASLTFTTGAASFNRFVAFIIRGLTNPAITADALSDWSSTTTAANTDEGPSALSFNTGQIGVFVGIANSGTVTFPSNTTPAAGWVTDHSIGNGNGEHRAAHVIGTTSGTVQANIRSTQASALLATWMLVAGDVVSTPPLTSTFVGWGNPIF